MKRNCVLFYALLFFVFLCGDVLGSGFHIGEQGAKAMGMANAFVAQADDPSALFYNPAGISFQEGTTLSLGITTILVPESEFNGETALGGGPSTQVSETARGDVFFPPNLYLIHSFKNQPISIGIGFNSLFPLAKRWRSTSDFRDDIKEISIKPFNVQPTISYRIDKFNLAFAAGIDYTYAKVWLENSPYSPLAPVQLGDMEIDGSGDGWGYNFGVLWKPVEKLSFGISYRSEIKLDIDGDADFLSTTGGVGPANFSTSASTDITLPEIWKFGVAYKPVEKLTLEFDVDRYGWTSYDELAIKFGSGSTVGPESVSEKDWGDTWTYHFGAQYSINENFNVRVGYAYDNTPVPEDTMGPELPDADRHNYSIGFGYQIGQAIFDVAYMYVDFKDRNVDNDIQVGTYTADAHLIGANMTYSF